MVSTVVGVIGETGFTHQPTEISEVCITLLQMPEGRLPDNRGKSIILQICLLTSTVQNVATLLLQYVDHCDSVSRQGRPCPETAAPKPTDLV